MAIKGNMVHPYFYRKCGATSPLGNKIPASMRNFLAASLLATEAFLAASNLSCLLLSNKSILNLLVFMILLFFCKDYASERNESLLSNCRAQLIYCKITLFFRKMQAFSGKCLRVRKIKRITHPWYGK
nr:hypothetical protein [Prevotella sp.]